MSRTAEQSEHVARRTTERDELRSFQTLKDARHLSEGYGVSVAAIGCEHCHVIWERDRHDSRRATIADRRAAVRHLREVHGINP